MPERSASRLTTSTIRQKALLTGIAAEESSLRGNLLRLRAVLILLAARYGSKMATAGALAIELRLRGLRASLRSLYSWRSRYLRSGFAGIMRRRRNDAGYPRGFGQETFTRIVDAATRVRRHGDLACEFRKLHGAGISYRTFVLWVRRIQRHIKVVEMPGRGDRDGLLF